VVLRVSQGLSEIKDAFECINDGADQGLSNGTAGEDVRADAVA
jgi:hypothetical protein